MPRVYLQRYPHPDDGRSSCSRRKRATERASGAGPGYTYIYALKDTTCATGLRVVRSDEGMVVLPPVPLDLGPSRARAPDAPSAV